MKKLIKKCEGLAFQGDIALLAVGKLPKGAKKITKKLNMKDAQAYGLHSTKGLVLAQGESRQHFHAFRDTKNAIMYEVANDNKKSPEIFLVIKKKMNLVHEEHDPIEFKADVYRLFNQSEYTFEGEYRRVAD